MSDYSFKNAFKCKKCPQRNDQPDGCPCWWEVIMSNEQTGEKKVEKGCGFALLPEMLVHVISTSVHTTYAAYDMRNKVIQNVGKVLVAVKDKLQLPDVEIEEDNIILLEGDSEENGIS